MITFKLPKELIFIYLYFLFHLYFFNYPTVIHLYNDLIIQMYLF